jgi:hypothetical protein
MKSISVRSILIALITTAVMACAQSETSPDASSTRQLAARCAYTQSDDSCQSEASSSRQVGEDDREIAQVQFPRRGPRFGRRTPRPYGPPSMTYGSYDDARHTVIGGLIGFGAGFALGAAANRDTGHEVASGIVGGALGAVFGAAIGHAIATFPHASFRRHRPDYEEDWASARAAERKAHQSSHIGN